MLLLSPLIRDPQTSQHLAVLGAQNDHRWARLWTDGLEADLHALAAELGLQPYHALHHHNLTVYLLTPNNHTRALLAGAQLTDYSAWLAQHARSIEEQTLPLFP